MISKKNISWNHFHENFREINFTKKFGWTTVPYNTQSYEYNTTTFCQQIQLIIRKNSFNKKKVQNNQICCLEQEEKNQSKWFKWLQFLGIKEK